MKISFFSMLILFFTISATAVWGQTKSSSHHHHDHTHHHDHDYEPCGTDQLLKDQLKDPSFRNKLKEVEAQISNYQKLKRKNPNLKGNRISGYKIPVVFHIIEPSQFGGTPLTPTSVVNNVQTQLNLLNTEFANNGANIKFCLAEKSPSGSLNWSSWQDPVNGNPLPAGTKGITVTNNSSLSNFDYGDHLFMSSLASVLGDFDPTMYMNVYIVPEVLTNGDPTPEGISPVGPSMVNIALTTTTVNIDGLAVEDNVFYGSLGKVLTHEVGHWLGLYHVFGPIISGSNDNDFVCDTWAQSNPTSSTSNNCGDNYTNVNYPNVTCTSSMTYGWGENHMDYGPSNTCMNTFSPKQVERMYDFLDILRPNLHSDINLIEVGLNIGFANCITSNTTTADFNLSANGFCAGTLPIDLEGAPVSYSSWQFSVVNAPTGATYSFTSPSSGGGSQPIASILFSDPGIYEIQLLVGSISQTKIVEVLDCSPGDQRNRITHTFEDGDWGVAGMSIDQYYDDNGNVVGHMVAGSSVPSTYGNVSGNLEQGIIMQVDFQGKIQWRKEIAYNNFNVRILDVFSGVNYSGNTNCYAFTGYVQDPAGETEMFICITNNQGTILNSNSFTFDGSVYTAGLNIVQLNTGVFAVAGFSGDGPNPSNSKSGFVVGIEPNLTTLSWAKYYESGNRGTFDYDIAKSITAFKDQLGNDYLVIMGSTDNGISPNYNGSTFISRLDYNNPSNEIWRRTIYPPSSSSGDFRPISAGATPDGRLFAAIYSLDAHGSFIIELDLLNSGNIGSQSTVFSDFIGFDMIVDGNSCILSGCTDLTAPNNQIGFKIPIPNQYNGVWPSNIIKREYDNSRIVSLSYGNSFAIFDSPCYYTPENLTRSPIGGYLMVAENRLSTINIPNNIHQVGLIFNKIDEILVGSCSDLLNFTPFTLPNPYLVHKFTPRASLSFLLGGKSLFADNKIATCFRSGCFTFNGATVDVNKCINEDLQINVLPNDPALTYNWTPPSWLDNPFIADPECSSSQNITYAVAAADPQTGCTVLETEVNIQVNGSSLRYPIETEDIVQSAPDYVAAIDQNDNSGIAQVGFTRKDFQVVEVPTSTVLMSEPGPFCSGSGSGIFVSRIDECSNNPNTTWTVGISACVPSDAMYAPDVEIDDDGNVYVAFSFTGSFTVGSTAFSATGMIDIAVLQFDPTGNFVTGFIEGGADGNDYVSDIEFYDNKLVIAGYLEGLTSQSSVFDVDGGPNQSVYNLTYTGMNSSFAIGPYFQGVTFSAQYELTNGIFYVQWATPFLGESIGTKVSVDENNGDVYAMGLTETLTLQNNNSLGTNYNIGMPNANDDTDYFLIKLNNQGQIIWAESYGSDFIDVIDPTIFPGIDNKEPLLGYDVEVYNNSMNLAILLPCGVLSNTSPGNPFSFQNELGTHLVKIEASSGAVTFAKGLATPMISGTSMYYGNCVTRANLAVDTNDDIYVNATFLLENHGNTGFSELDLYGNNIDVSNMQSHILNSGAQNLHSGWFLEKFDGNGTIEWSEINTTLTGPSGTPQYPSLYFNSRMLCPTTDIAYSNTKNYIFSSISMVGEMFIGGGVGLTLNGDNLDGYIIRHGLEGPNNYVAYMTFDSSNNQVDDYYTEIESINLDMQVLPNPSTGKFTLSIHSNAKSFSVSSIQVFDITGKLIKDELTSESQNTQYEIDMSGAAAGTYFLRILANNQVQTKRIVLIK